MEYIAQNKGTALEKIPKKVLVDDDKYFLSIKRDGQMVQIAYDGEQEVAMWSSNGKPFYNKQLAATIVNNCKYAFHIEAEYTGQSEGLMGDRGKSSKITTYRTEFAKGILSEGNSWENFWVFDILSFADTDVRQHPFEDRISYLAQLGYKDSFKFVEQYAGFTVQAAKEENVHLLEDGHEGVMLTHATHVVKDRGRSTLRIKLKETPTGYATIVGTKDGTAEREGTIGSVTLEDEDGLVFSSGTGLNREEWELDPARLIGIPAKFGYESVNAGNYIQPRFLGAVLPDKSVVRLSEYLRIMDGE